jgi:hypothetical protein
MRRSVFVGASLALFLGSFFGTLWLTGTATPPATTDPLSAARQLAGRNISNRSDLIQAAVAAGLHASTQLKGHIDSITRANDREVTIGGWLADAEGDATPLAVLVFVPGEKVAGTQTGGERPDVTEALGLAFGAEKNVAFAVSFGCRAGQAPIIVGIGLERQYLVIASPKCP